MSHSTIEKGTDYTREWGFLYAPVFIAYISVEELRMHFVMNFKGLVKAWGVDE